MICLLAIPALAVPENITTGHYNISFDIGLSNDSYKINISAPKITESLGGDISTNYDISIRGGLRLIGITLTEREDGMKLSPSDVELILRLSLEDLSLTNIDIAKRIIDKSNGAVATGKLLIGYYKTKEDIYAAIYYPSFNNNLSVTIYSNYPWDEGTLQLLKTIYVEKVAT